MSMRDYLLTKLRLKADEQQRALDIERARAESEAAVYNTQVKALGKAADVATSLIGKGFDAADAAKAARATRDLEEIKLKAKLRAGETGDASSSSYPYQLSLPESQYYTTKPYSLFGEKETPGTSAASTANANQNNLDASKTLISAGKTAVDALLKNTPDNTADLTGQTTQVPTEAQVTRRGGPTYATPPASAEQFVAIPSSIPVTKSAATKTTEKKSDLAPIPEYTGKGDIVVGQPAIRPKIPIAPPQQTYYMAPAADATARSETVAPAAASPAPTPPITGTASDIPDIPEFKLQYGIDLSKPSIQRAVMEAPSDHEPLHFKQTSKELAKEIVDGVWSKRPPANPLTAFFNHGKATGDEEQARRMAELKAELMIREERKSLQAAHEADYLNSLDIEKRKEEINLIRSKSVLANANAEKENVVKFKTDLPSTERGKLQGFDIAQKSLNNLTETTRDALAEGKGLPIGTDRLVAQAYVKANAAKTGSDAASISAGTGVLGGASLSISQARSGKPLDENLLWDAFESVDRSGWTPKQKLMHMEKFKAIQNLGKALEGGKLTDADYKKYVEILINSDDPQTYLMSINRLMKDNYENYGNYKTNLAGTYEQRVLAGFEPKDPTDNYFTEDEIKNAFAAPISAAAAGIAQQGAIYRGPGTSIGPLVGGVAEQIQALAKKAAELDATDPAAAAAIRAEIEALKAKKPPSPTKKGSGGSGSPPKAWGK